MICHSVIKVWSFCRLQGGGASSCFRRRVRIKLARGNAVHHAGPGRRAQGSPSSGAAASRAESLRVRI